jgi:hypothetical protein
LLALVRSVEILATLQTFVNGGPAVVTRKPSRPWNCQLAAEYEEIIMPYLVRIWPYNRIWPAEVPYLALNDRSANTIARHEIAIHGIVLLRHFDCLIKEENEVDI